jgi:transposase InsO family protein
MSRKGNCWDNAVAESFFSSFAFELEFEASWHDVQEVERAAGEYIEGVYNQRRRHSHNRYLSPIDFEHQFAQQANVA